MKFLQNIRGKDAVTNISRLYMSQLISVGFSILLSLYIPKFIGVKEFSYWQLFLFYASYTGMLHLGLNDGLYLRYGGCILTDQECRSVSSQLWVSCGIIAILCGLAVTVVGLGMIPQLSNPNLIFVFCGVAVYAVVNIVYGFCGSLCQAINRFKEYTNSYIIDRLIMAALLIAMVCMSIKRFEYIEVCWIISMFIVTFIMLFRNRDIFLRKVSISEKTFQQIGSNIGIGINLMLSNVSSMLIIGICNFFISEHYPITTFGYVAFSLSLCNFALLFISKIGIGIYPLLKKKKDEFHKVFFGKVDYLLTVLMPLSIVFFPILNLIVRYFLPNYYNSLEYLSIFFPLAVFSAKIEMLYSTYLKVLREERYLLRINIYVMSLSMFLSAIGIYLLDNIPFTLICVSSCIILKACFMRNRINKIFKTTCHSLVIYSDIAFSIIYLVEIGVGVDFNIAVYSALFMSLINIFFQRRHIKEDVRYLFIARRN